MKRRTFLRQAGPAAAAGCVMPRIFAQSSASSPTVGSSGAQPIQATLTIDSSAGVYTLPEDFIGLSYESAQLANPAFFAAENSSLVGMVRELSSDGVLRIGGNSSEFTQFTTNESTGVAALDAAGPDSSKHVDSDTPVTPKALSNLRTFLDATNWRCIYGLNAARGTAENAAEEASYVDKILGPRLIAFQIGNEVDAWRTRYRPATWSYPDYWQQWLQFHAAIVARVPHAKFAGPDIASRVVYVTGFAADAKNSAPDVVMLTSHYYAMGPAGGPGMTIDKLLSPDSRLEGYLKTTMDAAHASGLPYRMSEGNTCWNGGQEGVSDTLASALWAPDMMLTFATAGCAGVNFHGGGEGYYTPIAGTLAKGFERRPEYFGMLMMKPLLGATLVRSTLTCDNDRITAYAANKAGQTLVAAINKTAQSAEIKTSLRGARQAWVLSGPAIDAKQGVTLNERKPDALQGGVLHVPAYTAILLES
jgi:hypothetical protein